MYSSRLYFVKKRSKTTTKCLKTPKLTKTKEKNFKLQQKNCFIENFTNVPSLRVWVCADVDRAIHFDERCLKSLLDNEIIVQVTDAQMLRQQQQNLKNCNNEEKGVDEHSRTQLVEWLYDVCEAEHVDFVIFPLTVAFVDRVLASKFMPRRNLQALGAACLLLASKLKAPVPLSATQIASYCCNGEDPNNIFVMEADSSLAKETSTVTILNNTTIKTTTSSTYLTTDELLDWEMLVVNQLNWNLLQSTAFEFFDQILVRSPVLEALREDFARCLHKMQKDLSLATQLPSIQASACLLFCALRSRRQHLFEEGELIIRRYFCIDPVNSLVPFFETIGATMGISPDNLSLDVQKLLGVYYNKDEKKEQ
ncbi:CYCLIN domain-containing protein [Meloidogyne graminicola]|uniref:CYCLIN domain-containing protein n=1 Tax=Meloidogyne graminicola TaxID=189291 RepID=A0A8S9ZNY0_9BILA|nr:CYCLIN domain-containing protein [Meloidogyne graminicola]